MELPAAAPKSPVEPQATVHQTATSLSKGLCDSVNSTLNSLQIIIIIIVIVIVIQSESSVDWMIILWLDT